MDDEIDEEIEQFSECFARFPFKILDKIGQGTFSSVYKAIDLDHQKYDNKKWCRKCGSHPSCGLVALKRIYATSSPQRILTELDLLHSLGNHPNIAPLITAFRHEDQVVAVLAYFDHDSFKSYYRKMTNAQIQSYMKALLQAIEHVHSKGYIHRDVKPSNFLYKLNENNGVLIDFGLAQYESDHKKSTKFKQPNAVKPRSEGGFVKPDSSKSKSGYIPNDSRFVDNLRRPSIRANRAGTRGFRAPEVLFRVVHQTRAIDLWAAGVILLSILCGQFPFFQSSDDNEALLEIAEIFGLRAIQKIAASLDRTFETNIPEVSERIPFRVLIERLRPGYVDQCGNTVISLLEGLLTLDANSRLTATEALAHPFFDTL